MIIHTDLELSNPPVDIAFYFCSWTACPMSITPGYFYSVYDNVIPLSVFFLIFYLCSNFFKYFQDWQENDQLASQSFEAYK